ncbi:major facilitator superfamily domain-containing protein [Elsinoe ampelina]|uniref:Major facilitator superfamily domain-containing protein n=1 Tax=Elsinoe ampelina TaxID=302913 RepID=A0A6A6GN48_9PEZI|nr:major facilitator superfamily domain-containing protein [Elsinoe ampelina]
MDRITVVEAGSDNDNNSQEKLGNAADDVDEAYRFLVNVNVTEEELVATDLKKIQRKIDSRMVPIMLAGYFFTFIDKVLLNYAAVMGMNREIKLVGNQFSNANSFFFITYLVATPLNGYVVNRLPAAKWLGTNILLWGVTTACGAAIKNYGTLLAIRLFLGLFESAMNPSTPIILSAWYTKKEQAARFASAVAGMGVGQVIGGLLSFGFQHVNNPSFSGWRALHLFCGGLTCLLGLCYWLFIPDSPLKAKFLSDAEKVVLLRHIASNRTTVSNYKFTKSQLVDLAKDPQTYFLTILMILTMTPSGVIAAYSTTLISGFGYGPRHAALLNIPSGLVAVIFIMGSAWGFQKYQSRGFWLALVCVPGMIGGGLMSFMPRSQKGALLAGVYLVNSIPATVTLNLAWASSNFAGVTKRAFIMAVLSGAFAIGSLIGPQTFQAKDAPDYIPAKLTLMIVLAVAIVLVGVLLAYYRWENARRDRVYGKPSVRIQDMDPDTWANVTDRQNTEFRYVY